MKEVEIKKAIIQVLRMDGEQKLYRLYRSFYDVPREVLCIAIKDLINSESIMYTGHPSKSPEGISIHPHFNNQ